MSFTTNTGKEGSNPKKPLFLVTVVAPDGDTTYLTTSAYYGAPNIVYGGQTWLARILGNDIDAIAAMGPQGYDTVPGFTLSLADGDKVLWNDHCAPHGWRGSAVTLTVILWDVAGNTYSTDAIQWSFIGGNPQFSAKDGKLTVDVTSSCNFTRLKVPSVPIQYRCPWAFPPDAVSRGLALNDQTSPFYQCGYSVDQAGGVGNYATGTTPFVVCDYTRSGGPGGDPSVGCMARLGNGATTSVAPDGDLLHDKAGHYTGRFGGVTWIAPTGYKGKSYTGQGTVFGFNAPNTAIVGNYYNWVYGTQWVSCTVLAPASDPNSTRSECIVCFAPFGSANVIKLLVNGVEVPQSNSDQLFTWRYISAGGRNGALEGDDIFNNHSDPHGSMCAIEFVVPIQLAGGGSTPNVQALVTGGPILSINSGLGFVYNAPDEFDTGVFQSNNIAGPAANPIFAYLDLVTWGNVPVAQIDAASFYAAALLMRNSISYVAADGTTQTHAGFKASFQLAGTQRQTLANALTGLRNAANLMVAPNSLTGLIQCFVKQSLYDQQPAPIAGSNDSTARDSIDYTSTTGIPSSLTPGYYAYVFDESNIEKDSFRITSPKINAIPTTVAFGFQDEYNGYQNDSITEIDPASFAYSGNQEITVPISVLGIPNFDQATRQANVLLAEALYGNPRDDAGGTLYFEFSTNQRALHLASRLGYICGLTFQVLGIGTVVPQAIRILSAKPDTDGEHWQIKAAWHKDFWYTTAYGQNPTPFQNNPLLGAPIRPPYPWAPGVAIYGSGDALFPSRDGFQLDLDTTVAPAAATISGMLPVNKQPSLRPPLMPPQLSTASTGGSIKPGSYYIAISVDSIDGPASQFSTVVVPAGTTTNTITLSAIRWNSGASPSYQPYAGTDPMHMRAAAGMAYTGSSPDANGNPTVIVFTNLGIDGPGLPDIAFNGFQIIQTGIYSGGDFGAEIEGLGGGGTVLTLSGAGLVVNAFANHVLSLVYRPNVSTQPALNMLVTSNASGTLTMPSAGFLVGDIVIMRFKPDTFSASTIGDSAAINSLNGGAGFPAYDGRLVMIIAGTGVGYPPKLILSNTSTVITIAGTFDVTPDATTVFVVINPDFNYSSPTPAFTNDGSVAATVIGKVTTDHPGEYESYDLIQVATIDINGNYSPLQYQPFRELYVPPQIITVSTTATISPGIIQVIVDATGGPFTITLPPPGALNQPMKLARKDSTTNVVTLQHSSGTIGTASSIALDNQVLQSVTLVNATGTTSAIQNFWGTIAATAEPVITAVIDGGGSVPSTGLKTRIRVPFACTITGWTMIGDQTGSAQITVKKSTYAAYPTTTSIVASAPPAISSAQKNTSTVLTGWTVLINAGDVLDFNLDSITSLTQVTLELTVTV